MSLPEAVRKHDGRVVAYDSAKLAGSIARAAKSADPTLSSESAKRIGHEISSAVAAFLVEEGKPVPASADIRALTVKLLRETKHDAIADVYAEESRSASSLLWRIRVVEPGTPFTSTAGSPWDRRRLLESLRASGIGRDPAGEAAREVERRVVALGQERISPALIHALTSLVLTQRAMDPKSYGARRIAFSMSMHVPRFDPAIAEEIPLPAAGPALEEFWLQSIHSQDVVRAARENILSLEPYPSGAEQKNSVNAIGSSFSNALNPLAPEFANALRNWCTQPARPMWVCTDVPERAGELAKYLAVLPASLTPDANSCSDMNVLLTSGSNSSVLKPDPMRSQRLPSAPPVTINLAGLMVREALRDQTRATVRLAQSTALAAQAHREREEYFGLSPVRGRPLPVAIAGLWNAAAWLQGESFEIRQITRNARTLAATLISVVRGALETLRTETGMELMLVGGAPMEATRQLWRRDREFLLRDGVSLDANSIYDGGPAVRIFPGSDDFSERIDFAKAAGAAFDEPPAVQVEVPLGAEPDAAIWREFFASFALAGVPRLQLMPGGSTRSLRLLTRAVRTHAEGFPLFEQMQSS